ncbi:MAG: hydrogenase [Kiritimatiellaeota bacterium]|nr:hydrogenase [Kiritimatiellota bacterium]
MMLHSLTSLLLVFLVLANLRLLGASRLNVCIRTVAAQGVALSLLPLLNASGLSLTSFHALALPTATALVKGALFPWLLFRALREAHVQREVEPYVGFTPSLLFGVGSLAVGGHLAARLPLPGGSPLLVPVALATMLTGLFLIIARRQALMQVVGYLALENGIFAFGASVMKEAPLLVEMGILLDVFVAVFIMGITVFHISREFEHTDTERLSALKDWSP